MTRIIAGRFDQRQQADRAVDTLRRRGFASDQVSAFFLNAPGQHARFPLGGDENVSPGASEASSGAAKGAAIGGAAGLALGLAAAPIAGAAAPIAGAGVGAYAGSLVGALQGMKAPVNPEDAVRRPENEASEIDPSGAPPRPAGVMVAARVRNDDQQSMTIEVLRSEGAVAIERADGQWRDGRWVDFDPVKAPDLV